MPPAPGTRWAWIARPLGFALVACAVGFGAVCLAPELKIGRAPLNDLVFHRAASEWMEASLARGEPFLDPWVSEWSLGYPVWRSYPPLAHLLGALVLGLALLPVGLDRTRYLEQNAAWGRESLAAYESERADLDAALGDVTLRFDLPAGEHRVVIELRPTPVRRAALLVTALTSLLLVALASVGLHWTARSKADRPIGRRW